MSSPSTKLPTPEGPRRRSDHPRLIAARNALLWLVVIVLAVTPFPLWW
jgi:hypothetical protein